MAALGDWPMAVNGHAINHSITTVPHACGGTKHEGIAHLKTHVVLVSGLAFAMLAPAQAEERSPYFGSEDTETFQVVIDEPPALLQAETTLAGAEISCELPDCPSEAKLAKETEEAVAP